MKLGNKKIIIFSILFIIVILIISIIIYLNVRIVDDNSAFTLKNNLTAEVYSDVKIKDYIDSIEGKIIDKDKINTNKLGLQEISFIYLNNDNKKRRGTFEIEVVDTEKPLVWINNSYSTLVGEDIDLENKIICADNYDNKPTCKINGDYDINTPGTYDLTFIASDKSGNTVEKLFNLVVMDNNQSSRPSNNVSEEILVTKFSDVIDKYKTNDNEIGIDVSRHQKDIDFKKVKNAGASFVMIRVGYQNGVGGKYELDPYFKKNIKNALKNKLKVGIYFYSYADSEKEAKKQAKWVIKQIKDYDISLPVVFDFESFSDFNEMELSIFGLNEVADSFINTLNKAGYNGMLYGSKNYLNTIWKYHTKEVWLAHYTEQTDYDGDYMMWQLCDDGQIDGIEGYVDIDILYK